MWLCPLEPFLWRLFTISLSSLTLYKHVSLDCIMPGISDIWFPSTDCQLQTLFWLPTLFIAFDPIKQTNEQTKQQKTTKPTHKTKQQYMSFFFQEGQILWDPVFHPCILLWQLTSQCTSGLRLQHQIQTHSRPRAFVSASGLCKESPAYLWVNGQHLHLLEATQLQSTLTGWCWPHM